MAFVFSNGVLNALAAAFAAEFPAGSVLQLRSGSAPGPTAAGAGTLLAEITTGGWSGPTNGVLTRAGTWEDPTANAAGTLAHWRLMKAADGGGANASALRVEGTIGVAGSGADMIVDNTNVALNQPISVTTFQVSVTGAP